MQPTKIITLKIGILYLMMGIPAAFTLGYLPTAFVVNGDASETARNIIDRELVYRLTIFSMLISQVSFLFLALSLYSLFKEVDRIQSRILVAVVAVGVAIELVNCFNLIAPLVLLHDTGMLSSFSRPQLDALAFSFLKLHSTGLSIVTAFWGIWLIPFGILIMKSRYFPKILGTLLILASLPYLVNSVTSLLFPYQTRIISMVFMPLMLGEVPVLFWLLFNGATVQLPPAIHAHPDSK